jgi:thiosulfate/3-mercaptopyruvate sulfurtransferase
MKNRLLTRRQFTLAAGALAFAPRLVAAAPDQPYVVDSTWLQTRLASDSTVVVLDVSPLRAYQDRHIHGAIHVWWQDTMELNNSVYGTSLSTGGTSARAQLLQDLGIDDSTMVVAYDNDDNRWAARMIWFLRWLSHDAAAILDGGLDAWKAAGGSTESGSNDPAKRGTPTIASRSSVFLESSRLVPRLQAGQSQLLDVRTESEAHDNVNGLSKIGRIPGSISFPWTNAVADHRLKPADQITALLSQAGVTTAKPIILYARYGVEADHTWVVLKSIGYPNVAVYDLGFVGWQANPDRPIEPLPAS